MKISKLDNLSENLQKNLNVIPKEGTFLPGHPSYG